MAGPLVLLVLAIVTGFFQAVLQWPWYSKLLGLAGLLWLLVAVVRYRKPVWERLRMTFQEQERGTSLSFIHSAGGNPKITATGNLMQVGGSSPQVALLAPAPSTPAVLRARATQISDLCQRLDAFLFQRDIIRNGIEDIHTRDWDAMSRSLDAANRYDEQTWTLFRRDFGAEVVHAYEEARSRGFGDSEMERVINIPVQMRHGHSSFLPTIAQRLRVVSLQMTQRAADIESGNVIA